MKTFVTFFALVLMSIFNLCAQSQRQIVKTLDLKGQSVVASFHGSITVVESETDFVRVTATVSVSNFSDDILKKLVEVGRYDIQTSLNKEGKTVIAMPAIEKRVVIKGVDLVEHLSYEIQVPKGMDIQIEKLDMPISNNQLNSSL